MSSSENQNYQQQQEHDGDLMFYRVNRLTEKIISEANKLRLLQKKALFLKTQVNKFVGSEKFKLLFDLSNCYNQIIEFFSQNYEQNLNEESFEYDYSEDGDSLYDQFKVQPISKIIEDRTNIMDQYKKMVENAKEMTIQLDQQILLKPQNYQLYLQYLQHQQIIILNKVGEDQFLQELQNAFQILQTASINNPNYQKLFLDKQVEFCKQMLKNLDFNSLEYLLIVMQIMKIYDDQIKLNPEITKHLKKLKVMELKGILGYGPDIVIFTIREIQQLEEICENCISSLKPTDLQNKIEEINNLTFQQKFILFLLKYIQIIRNSQFKTIQIFSLHQKIIKINYMYLR